MGSTRTAARKDAIDQLAAAAYKLSASDARLRGRATRDPGALSLAHARALRSLAEAGPMSVSALAVRVETTGAAVTQLVNGLERAGLVRRERSVTGDRRTATVSLTDRGRAIHEERQAHLERLLGDAVADLEVAGIHQVATVLLRLTDLYDEL
ncbi:MarR family transcriptional regulator [Mycolicibacterium cosmeticum]|uniref:MarR family transcriptional regulator n=1 Tax=Mycolicibacterium cosmeticum TaxID=258533 RepID=UPI003204ADCD